VRALSERGSVEKGLVSVMSSLFLWILPFWYQSRLRGCGQYGACDNQGNMRREDHVFV
jgi:hypothetical protein